MCSRLKASCYHYIQYRIISQLARYSIFLYFVPPFPYYIPGGQAFARKQPANRFRAGGPFPLSFPADPTLPHLRNAGADLARCVNGMSRRAAVPVTLSFLPLAPKNRTATGLSRALLPSFFPGSASAAQEPQADSVAFSTFSACSAVSAFSASATSRMSRRIHRLKNRSTGPITRKIGPKTK